MLTELQKQTRNTGIGGSDSAAVCGIDPYRQPLDVWLEKTTGTRDETIGAKECVIWGNALEDAIAMEWSRRNSVKVRRDTRLMRHDRYRFVIGNIDRRVEGKRQGLEIKARGTFAASDYGDSGTDEVKDTDMMQCQHYMLVTGWNVWHMAILIGGQELRSFRIERNDNLIKNMLDIYWDFWEMVVTKEAPKMRYEHSRCDDLIKRLYPGTNGETILLPQRAIDIKEQLDEHNQMAKEYANASKALNNELKAMIGEAAIATLPGGGGWTRKVVKRKAYQAKASEYYSLRFSKKL